MKKLIETHIPGLDEILKGGLREGNAVLVTGPPGTGKTILCLQFILEGAKNGKPGIYMTSEETVDDIRGYAESLGYDIKKLEKEGLVTLVHQPISTKKLMTIAMPINVIIKKKIKRVVLDSITLLKYGNISEDTQYRKEILDFVTSMKETGVNLMGISEKSISNIDNLHYDPEDFLFDGLLILTKIRKGASYEHTIHISKMRGQDHAVDIFPFKINNKGLEIFPKQPPFSLIEKEGNFK
jgi:circadian clock protein KaiC